MTKMIQNDMAYQVCWCSKNSQLQAFPT